MPHSSLLRGDVVAIARQRSWGCQRLCSSQPKANQNQRVNRSAIMASQGQGQPTLEMEASDRMRRLGEDAQEAFASGNPDTLRQDGGDMMEGMLKEMEIVRKRVLEKPGVLPQLVAQLRMGDIDQQSKAAEMLFCVVGQGPGRDVAATKQALECGLLQAILTGIQSVTAQPSSRLRQDQDAQQLISLLVAMLSQLTMEKSDQAPIHSTVSQGGVKLLRSLFDVIASDGGQQNLVSMLWHWSTCNEDIRQQVMDIGMPELQVGLLGLQHSPVQRQTAADQLSAYVSFPTQQEDSDQPPDSRLAADLVHAGAPMQLIEMLSSRYHDQVRCSAAQAICTLATFSPKSKMNIIAAGAYHPVVAMLQRSESPAVKEAGCHLIVTLATGDPGAGPIFTQPEAAVQFAAIGAISALADMLRPVNEPSTRITAILVLHIMANAYEDRVQKALVSAQVVPLFLDLLRVLSGRLPWDSSLDELERSTIEGIRLKSAEILAMVAINNQAHTRLLVDTGAIPELVLVASGSEVPEEDREPLLRMLHHLCKSDGDVLAILSAMMAET